MRSGTSMLQFVDLQSVYANLIQGKVYQYVSLDAIGAFSTQ
jgi:hypothetical protein